jgi:hypothetical protein
VVLSNLNAGSYIGEIALVNKIPRTANFKTLTTCLCLKVIETDFAKFVAKSPAIKEQLLDLVKVNGPPYIYIYIYISHASHLYHECTVHVLF